uniref:mitogen-activated protein kinase kinase kinase n=1 Tax=Nelumbo nucifera TaxID=4432 RepID=A0A822ZR40_NELNU|nr:TPA_asm: hypothetical protein HUJ06_017270 [Nelumbo nucifera]
MPSWWGKSLSKEVKKKTHKESFIDTLHRKFKIPSEEKSNSRSCGSRRHSSDVVSEKGSLSRVESRSQSPSTQVSRCQSFAERSLAQPLPLPGLHPASIGRTDSGISITKPGLEKYAKHSLHTLPKPGCIPHRPDVTDVDGDLATASISSDCSIDSDDPVDSRLLSSQAIDNENGPKTALSSPSSLMHKDHSLTYNRKGSREVPKLVSPLFNNQVLSTSPKRGPLSSYAPNLQIPHHGAFGSAPDSSLSSPSRSPMRVVGADQMTSSAFWGGKPFGDVAFGGSGHCSSPGSGHNSGHNSMGADLSGQLFWQHSRGSPECSPIPSPRMTSPGPSSRIHSGAVTPLHPRAGGAAIESPTSWQDDGKQQSHRLPLPPITISNSSPFTPTTSAACMSPSVPRSPGRAENPTSPGSRWKKGRLLGRGTFGHVYVGFNSESGEMCAMKEVTLFSDDAKSRESAKQLMQEISLLSRLRHPNIVQYYGTEMIAGQSCPLSFKGSPYWMAPEVIKNANCNLAVDIWSLGCTVLEMATTKPPWSQYEGVAAMFKIGNSKELPAIPDHLSDEGKDFLRQCLQRNPQDRPTATKLLEHPFVKNAAPLERPILDPPEAPPGVANVVRSPGVGHARNLSSLDSEGMGVHQSRGVKNGSTFSDSHMPRNISCPVSPIGSPLLHSRSPRMSPSPISSPHTMSGSSTPLTGGNGAIPFHHLKQSAYMHDGFGSMPRSPNSMYVNGSTTFHDPRQDLFRGMQPGSQVFRDLVSSESDALGMQFGRHAHGDSREFYDGQSVLADRVSQQLLKDHVKSKPSLDLSPVSPMLGRSNGI